MLRTLYPYICRWLDRLGSLCGTYCNNACHYLLCTYEFFNATMEPSKMARRCLVTTCQYSRVYGSGPHALCLRPCFQDHQVDDGDSTSSHWLGGSVDVCNVACTSTGKCSDLICRCRSPTCNICNGPLKRNAVVNEKGRHYDTHCQAVVASGLSCVLRHLKKSSHRDWPCRTREYTL